jgi:hypothetical protein
MLRHYRSKKCQLVRAGITNAVVNIEKAISPFKMENKNGSPTFTSQSSTSAFTEKKHENDINSYVENCFTQYEKANAVKLLKF